MQRQVLENAIQSNHILPDKCPKCGEVARNDMSVQVDPKTRQRVAGHVQFACNYEVEVYPPEAGQEPVVIRDCKKGQVWPAKRF